MIKPKETKKALTYMDDRGWLYQVRQLLGGDLYRVFCRKPRKNPDPEIGWKSRPRSRIHLSRETAEDALRALAKRKGWVEMDFDTEDVMAMSAKHAYDPHKGGAETNGVKSKNEAGGDRRGERRMDPGDEGAAGNRHPGDRDYIAETRAAIPGHQQGLDR